MATTKKTTKTTTKKNTEKKTPVKKPAKKEVKHITPDVIYDVLDGKYGTEGERNRKLTAAGYSPSAVTKKLNDLAKLVEELEPIKTKAGKYYGCLLAMVSDSTQS